MNSRLGRSLRRVLCDQGGRGGEGAILLLIVAVPSVLMSLVSGIYLLRCGVVLHARKGAGQDTTGAARASKYALAACVGPYVLLCSFGVLVQLYYGAMRMLTASPDHDLNFGGIDSATILGWGAAGCVILQLAALLSAYQLLNEA